MKKRILAFTLCVVLVFALAATCSADEKVTVLKYAHMNTEDNTSGMYAQWFADRVEELTNGSVHIDVYPNSQLGSIQEMAEMVSAGTIQLHHNTWGGLSAIYEKLEYLDTPYIFKSIEDGIKVNDITTSPVLQELNEELIANAGVRILNSIYGGARELTCNKPVYSPADLKGVKVRAIPSPIYVTAVEGMGAIAVAVDWADTPAALATGVADGQENPPVSIYTANLQETQKYMMDTKHILAIGPTVMNEAAYQALTPEQQAAIDQAAYETWEKFNAYDIEQENGYIQKLIDDGVTFIKAEDGLKVDEFKASVDALVAVNYAKYADEYAKINEYLGY